MARKLEERGVYNTLMWHIWPESQLGSNWYIHIESTTPPTKTLDLLITPNTDVVQLSQEYGFEYRGLIEKLLRMVLERMPAPEPAE